LQALSKMASRRILAILCALACVLPAIESFTSSELTFDAGELGLVKGSGAKTTKTGRPYVQFLGIPYAQPLTKNTRFQPPTEKSLPLASPGRTFSATRKPACCPQPTSNILCAFNQKEDCLGMNIYTPQVQNSDGSFDKLLPVIVFIHGGAFYLGSGDGYGGARLLERDVVLVNFNYRLGPLGFFNLNTAEAPGNAAMYDMVMALNFVKKHISHFGGDPERITIAGQSAGSVSVTHLMASPLTRDKNLFSGAIGMSGSALLKWGTVSQEESVGASLQIARALGCTSNDLSAVASCMRGKTTSAIIKKLEDYQSNEKHEGRLGFAPAAPSIQSNPPAGVVPFMDESPEAIFERHAEAKVPLIMGSTRHDGSFVLGVVYNQFIKYNGLQNNASFIKNQLVNKCLSALGVDDPAISEALAVAYLGEARNSGSLAPMLPGLNDLHTVFYFKDASFKTLNLHAQVQPKSYWYEFDFKGKNSVYSVMVNTNGNPVQGGITHGDDLTYLFNVPLMSLTNDQEQAVSDRLVNYWANFAATGNPNVDEAGRSSGQSGWLSYNQGAPHYASINTEDSFLPVHPETCWNGASQELY